MSFGFLCRIAATGGSAGAGISLWLGFHDDMADPDSEDPVLRQSTRLTCMLVNNGQTSYDPRFIRELFPGTDTYPALCIKPSRPQSMSRPQAHLAAGLARRVGNTL